MSTDHGANSRGARSITQKILSDRGSDLWYESEIRRQLTRAALLLTIHRVIAGAEKTLTLEASGTGSIFAIRSIHQRRFERFIWPLRATAVSNPLLRTSFAALTRINPDWHSDRGTPETFFMIGANLFGIHPRPTAPTNIHLTYLIGPPVSPEDDTALGLNSEWQDFLPLYAAAVLMGAEGKVDEAGPYMQQFMSIVGLPRDDRFLRGAEQQAETSTEVGTKQVVE